MNEIEEQDNFEYRDGIKLFEDFRDSKYSKDYINKLDEVDQHIILYYIQLTSDSYNIKLEERNIDFICKLALGLLKARDADEKKENYLIKENMVINFLTSKIVLNSICRYIVKHNYSDIWDNFSTCRNVLLISSKNLKFNIGRTINIEYLIHLLLPYIYNSKIDTFLSKLKDISNQEEIITYFLSIDNITSEIIKEEYKNNREFYEEIEKRIKNANFAKLITPLGSRVIKMDKNIILQLSKFTTLEFKEEYNNWKNERYNYSSSFHLIQYYYFWIYYIFIDKQLLYYFFRTLNEPHAFDKNQIDYIREMAPKLRISSYLNEEYAEYKKWHNPAARDFDFGKDEPEEEATVISKDHLERLSHFKEENLANLLDKLKENQYIEKDTRPKDWLFAFGMSGDEKPEFFKKIQWIGSSKNRGISPSYFTDFIGILGYDLNKIYFEESKITISILNSCFMTTNEPIDQKSFCREKGEFIPTTKHKKMAKLVKECGLLTE